MKTSVPVAVSYNIEILKNEKIPFHVRDNYAEELRGLVVEINKALKIYEVDWKSNIGKTKKAA